MPMSPIILIQILDIPRLAYHSKKQYFWSLNISFAYPTYGVTSKGHLERCFCSNTFFNLSRKALTDTEIWLLEKGLDFKPIQNINQKKPENLPEI